MKSTRDYLVELGSPASQKREWIETFAGGVRSDRACRVLPLHKSGSGLKLDDRRPEGVPDFEFSRFTKAGVD